VPEEPLNPVPHTYTLVQAPLVPMDTHLLYLVSLATLTVNTFLAGSCTVDLLIGSNAKLRTPETLLQLPRDI